MSVWVWVWECVWVWVWVWERLGMVAVMGMSLRAYAVFALCNCKSG